MNTPNKPDIPARPLPAAPADTRRRVISASVTLFVTAILSLFIPYATLFVGLFIAAIGGAALLWEKVPVMRRMWGIYVAAGLLLAVYGFYLIQIYRAAF